MKSIKNEVTVGLLFFISMAILSYFTIIMSGEFFEKHEYYDIVVIFPDIDGIGINDKVKVNGVTSGIVEEIQLLEDSNVKVKLKMYNKFKLYENYKIRIKNQTALGGKFISIYPGIGFQDNKTYAIVMSRKNLKGSGSGDIFVMLSDLIAENKTNLYNTINNIKNISAKINDGKGTLGKLINENKVHDNTNDLIQEVREAMEDSREQAPITSFIRAALLAF